MADFPHPASPGRSANMRANRRKDTKPELALRRALHAQGYRYRKDYRIDLAGARVRPDIAFTARRIAVFVDGCFWHACPEHGTQPAANTWYWEPKLARNVERDRAADAALAAAGWQVIRVWEHESLEAAVAAVVAALAASPRIRRQSTRAIGSPGGPGPGTLRSSLLGPSHSGHIDLALRDNQMRVYLPSTLSAVAGLLRSGEIGPGPLRGYSVTPALREWYSSGDMEELEYVALMHAAKASLRLLLGDPRAPRRRVVLAVEVPDAQVVNDAGFEEPGLVHITEPVKIRDVASGHVDDPVAAAEIAEAIAALPAADAGDYDARFVVDGADGHELLWYATQELGDLAR